MQAVLRADASAAVPELEHSPPAPHTAAAARALKEEGNEAFQAREYGGALARWSAALQAFPLLPSLLTSLAAAHTALSQPHAAILCATAALVWRPGDATALQRRAAAAAAEGWREAHGLAAAALRAAPGDPEAAALLGSLQAQATAAAVAAQLPRSPRKHGAVDTAMPAKYSSGNALMPAKYGDADELTPAKYGSLAPHDAIRAQTAGRDVAAYIHDAAESRRALRTFGKTNPNMLRYVRLWLGTEPAQLDEVFLRDEALPEGCREGACMQHLALTAASTFWNWMNAAEAIILVLARGGGDALAAAAEVPLEDPLGGEDNPGVGSMELAQRLRRTDRVAWWRAARVGDVDFSARLPFHDDKEIVANFGNTAQRALPMRAGGVHVAVGFVDLGVLAETLVARGGELGGLQWIGYDASAHAVAKTRVVLCMLRRGSADDSIVQVCCRAACCELLL